ncbi:Serine protease inhibitor 88Ea [Frankliniella fusca]|uniref:Serine protease inhibitor 88Ea n=1 Tax=Frankliniella fusca TaxID=407009 RepID=A0AAE1HAN1_9NEOP|nr:Serine protease inhibitor 88Ea [Frankliniella fusca]
MAAPTRGGMALSLALTACLACAALAAPQQQQPQQAASAFTPPRPLCVDEAQQMQASPRVALQALSDGQRAFSVSLLRHLAATSEGNLFVSPHSIYQALLLAYFTAAGHTERAVKSVLQLPEDLSKLAVLHAYKFDGKMMEARAANSSSYELRSANRLFLDKAQPVRECLAGILQDTELQRMDFAHNPAAARQEINQWVEAVTKGHIHDLIPEDGVHEQTKLILANAAYFKGLWQSQFPAEQTHNAVFHISSSERGSVNMMKQKGSFNYKVSEPLGAHVLELPYKGHDVSMYILLPPFVKGMGVEGTGGVSGGVDGVIRALTPEALLDLVDDQLMARQVEVAIPTFKVEQSADLVGTLEALGVGDLFKASANLTSLTGQPGITFDRIMHKAKIEVDEQGTKAAGATALFAFRSSRPLTPIQFICNHPFVYMLYDKGQKTVLFAGVYRTPKA